MNYRTLAEVEEDNNTQLYIYDENSLVNSVTEYIVHAVIHVITFLLGIIAFILAWLLVFGIIAGIYLALKFLAQHCLVALITISIVIIAYSFIRTYVLLRRAKRVISITDFLYQHSPFS